MHPSLRYLKHYCKPLASYSQKNEDVVVSRIFGKIERFVDIGANNGITGSNTLKFALQGAQGLCFEPVVEVFQYLQKLYSFNFKVKCLNVGISDIDGYLDIRIDGALSAILETEDSINKVCLKDYYSEDARISKIEVHPFNYYQEQFPEFCQIDLLSIDVEGHELNVIKGINFNKVDIKCIILETLGGKTSNYEKIATILIDNNLLPVLTNSLNTIFIHKEFLGLKEIYTIPSTFQDYYLLKFS
jgi:FkbM family methyltransferase